MEPADLKRARMRAGLSGVDLARALEMEPGTWRRMERGQRPMPLDIARRVAEILKCSVDDLITGENVGSSISTAPLQESTSPATVLDLPVWGIPNGSEVQLVPTDTTVARPASVAGNQDAYAMYVHDDLAAPRYDLGDVVIVDPIRPAKPNQWVVLGIPLKDKLLAEIWRLDRICKEAISVSRNEDTTTFARDQLASINLIVGNRHA